MQTLEQITGLHQATSAYGFYRFTSLANAQSFAERALKSLWIVLGECDADSETYEYWVVSPAVAERLTRAGYELL